MRLHKAPNNESTIALASSIFFHSDSSGEDYTGQIILPILHRPAERKLTASSVVVSIVGGTKKQDAPVAVGLLLLHMQMHSKPRRKCAPLRCHFQEPY
jgi:hypothetical protein